MNLDSIVDDVMKTVKTDCSGKWVSIENVREKLMEIMDPDWDYYSDLPSPSAYKESANIQKSA